MLRPVLAALLCLLPFTASAQFTAPSGEGGAQIPPGYKKWDGGGAQQPPALKPGQKMIQSGTGFFVSNTGHIITNEHVIHGCKNVTLHGTVQPTPARVMATNNQYDLALLKTDLRPTRVANLRDQQGDILVNDPVLVMGYPLEAGITGQYKVKKSIILGLQGPMNEPQWIQFRDAALQGNSGGPLLDTAGNVVGVVVGKTRMTVHDDQSGQETVKQADVAISLNVLKPFLMNNGVYFRSRQSQSYYALDQVEGQARGYIVNIHCDAGGSH
ncbi:trypsin-like serine protease [bacterium]|nr:trypsin-like serine protease [bacterium]